MSLLDKPGALAKIATCLGDAGISIDQMRQLNAPGDADDKATVLIVTHKAAPSDIAHAMTRFGDTRVLLGAPVAIRIEEV
jgi:homoserine dehydrogenase